MCACATNLIIVSSILGVIFFSFQSSLNFRTRIRTTYPNRIAVLLSIEWILTLNIFMYRRLSVVIIIRRNKLKVYKKMRCVSFDNEISIVKFWYYHNVRSEQQPNRKKNVKRLSNLFSLLMVRKMSFNAIIWSSRKINKKWWRLEMARKNCKRKGFF